MRLQMGSLQNCIIDNCVTKKEPQVGDGATVAGWSDRHAGTVTSVRRTRRAGRLVVTVQLDKAIRTDNRGMSESQEYRYERDPASPVYTFKQMKDGVLRESGGGRSLVIGVRDEYYDYSF